MTNKSGKDHTLTKQETRQYVRNFWKTGTTQENADGWFIGMVPDLVTGVWSGGEDRTVYWRATSLGSDANAALPVWGRYMTKVYADTSLKISSGDFLPPSDTTRIKTTFDCSDYQTPPHLRQQLETDDATEQTPAKKPDNFQ